MMLVRLRCVLAVAAVGWIHTGLYAAPEVVVCIPDSMDTDNNPYRPFGRYLCGADGETTRLKTVGYEEALNLLVKGEFCVAIVPPLVYVSAKRDGHVELVARIERNDAATYKSVLYANQAIIMEKKKLADQKFLYPSKLSAAGYLYPRAELKRKNIQAEVEAVPGGYHDVLKKVSERENAFAAIWSRELDLGRYADIPIGTLHRLREVEEEIPFDAIVINPALEEVERRSLRSRIGALMAMETVDLANVFPKETGITRVTGAEDAEYDSVRNTYCFVEGKGVIRMGLSLGVDPRNERDKLRGWRLIQDYLFRKFEVFLDVRVYPRDKSDAMLQDLLHDEIDIGEFSPIPAGKALEEELKLLWMPMFKNRAIYDAHFVELKKENRSKYPYDLKGKKIAVDVPSSASGYAYPLWHLHTDVSDPNLVHPNELLPHTDLQVVSALANNEAEFGAIADFKLKHMKEGDYGEELMNDAMGVVIVPGSAMEIPNGGYFASRTLSKTEARDCVVQYQEWLMQAGDHVFPNGTLSPSPLGMPTFWEPPEDSKASKDMQLVYRQMFPRPTTFIKLMVGAACLVVIVLVLFLLWYKPSPGREQAAESSPPGAQPMNGPNPAPAQFR